MLPIIGKAESKRLDTILTYLEIGDPSIKFAQEFFQKYDIKQAEFLSYLKEHGKEALKFKLEKAGLLNSKGVSPIESKPASAPTVHNPNQGHELERASGEEPVEKDGSVPGSEGGNLLLPTGFDARHRVPSFPRHRLPLENEKAA